MFFGIVESSRLEQLKLEFVNLQDFNKDAGVVGTKGDSIITPKRLEKR